MAGEATQSRPHTGRRRNEAARRAILDATAELLSSTDFAAVTIETIANRAKVGRQTIYRWWPSKAAVLVDLLAERAEQDVPEADTGSLRGDLGVFLAATFRSAGTEVAAAVLRGALAEALRDEQAAQFLRRFTAQRRAALRAVIDRAAARGEVGRRHDPELLVDQAFGVLWYRLLFDHHPVRDTDTDALAAGLAAQVR